MGEVITLLAFACRGCAAVSRVLTDAEGAALAARPGCDHAGAADMIVVKP